MRCSTCRRLVLTQLTLVTCTRFSSPRVKECNFVGWGREREWAKRKGASRDGHQVYRKCIRVWERERTCNYPRNSNFVPKSCSEWWPLRRPPNQRHTSFKMAGFSRSFSLSCSRTRPYGEVRGDEPPHALLRSVWSLYSLSLLALCAWSFFIDKTLLGKRCWLWPLNASVSIVFIN